MQDSYITPRFMANAYTCPACNSFANMAWENLHQQDISSSSNYVATSLFVAICSQCNSYNIWHSIQNGFTHSHPKLLFPQNIQAPLPHPDMPDDILADFNEARAVLISSPRASAALLRLCVQKLCDQLCGSKGNINQQIKKLVGDGLAPQVQKALDTVRVVGNNAVHPGELDAEDVQSVAESLFKLVNYIVDDCISRPKQIDDMFESLPEGAKEAIKKRDEKKEKQPKP